MTQFIFRSDVCECEEPVPDSKTTTVEVPTQPQKMEPEFDLESEAEDLDIEDGTFPFGRYKPIKLLGRGANGTVYLAFDSYLNKKVAIKTLHLLEGEQLIAFQDEARATSKLNHPNIVKILDFGITEESTPYMVLDYFQAITLEQYLSEGKTLEWEEAQIVFSELCRALDLAHSKGIFHRDIKPSNIMISGLDSSEPRVLLIDFGIAKLTELTGNIMQYQGNTIVGTPNYMSPDSIQGIDYSVASEIYSVGCVLFEALTGKNPFEADSALELLNLHVNQNAPSLSESLDKEFPEDAETIVFNCLAKNPDERYQSMKELLNDLESGISHTEKKSSKQDLSTLVAVGTVVLLLIIPFTYILVNKIPEAPTKSSTKKRPKKPSKTNPKDLFIYRAKDQKLMPKWSISNFDDKLKYASKFPNARYLSLQDVKIDGTGIKYLIDSKIHTINLGTQELTAEAFNYLAEMKNLRCLHIMDSKVIKPGIKNLSASQSLSELVLGNTTVDYDDLANVTKLARLTHLNIYHFGDTTIPDAIFEKITDSQKIRYFSLNGRQLSHKQVKMLKKMKGLRYLYVGRCGLDDDDAKVIATLDIVSLNIGKNKLTNKGLSYFVKTESLKDMNIYTSACTEKYMDEFRKLRPDLNLRNHDWI